MKKRVTFLSVVLMICGIALLMLASCTKEEKIELDYTVIETPYCALQFPKKWKDYLYVGQNDEFPLIVSYYVQLEGKDKQHLFNIGFGSEAGEYIGSINSEENGTVDVYLSITPIEVNKNLTEEEKNIVLSMQEDLNYTIQAMPLVRETDQVVMEETMPPEPTEVIEYEDVAIETDYGNLYYPGEWWQYIEVEKRNDEEYTVAFYAKFDTEHRYRLYDVCFTEDLENVIGILRTENREIVGVKVNLYPIVEESVDIVEHINLLRSMQETVNTVMQKLSLEKVPEEVEEELQPTQAQLDEYTDVIVNTPYGQLMYSGKWADQMRIEIDDSELYTATFYGKVNKNPEQCIFTLIFGVEEDEAVAFVTDAESQIVAISIIPGEILVDDSWSDEEIANIYAMQEEINYILENLHAFM